MYERPLFALTVILCSSYTVFHSKLYTTRLRFLRIFIWLFFAWIRTAVTDFLLYASHNIDTYRKTAPTAIFYCLPYANSTVGNPGLDCLDDNFLLV